MSFSRGLLGAVSRVESLSTLLVQVGFANSSASLATLPPLVPIAFGMIDVPTYARAAMQNALRTKGCASAHPNCFKSSSP
eukprot:1141330-Pelagomonas_calceolata.AAC.5